MSVSGNDLKRYLRNLPGTDDEYESFVAAAKGKLAAAGVDETSSALYDLAVKQIGATMYLDRDLMDKTVDEISAQNIALASIVLPLRYGGGIDG